MSDEKLYRAVCKKCDYVERYRDKPTFLDPFFMSRHCPSCDDYKSENPRYGKEGWRIEYGQFKRKIEFVWLRPNTWFVENEWITISNYGDV